MDRRRMLKLSGLGLLGLGLEGCTPGGARFSLPRANASWGHVIRTSVGLRPHRPEGLRLEAEAVKDTVVIHNYGHGGSGVSLAWGTGHIAAQMAEDVGEPRVAVIGAGSVGLATARLLQRRGMEVTIYTKGVWPDPSVVTGHAPARFTPGYALIAPQHRTPEFDAMYERAAALSYRYWHDLVGNGYGVSWMYSYRLGDRSRPSDDPPGPTLTGVGESTEFGPGEHPFPTPYARRSLTLVMDTPVFLQATLRDFLDWGGELVIRTIRGPEEVLALDEPVVVNCSGLGGAEVWNDDGMEPLKGQLTMLVPQPEIDYVVSGAGFSLVPRSDSLMLGGAGNSPDDWSLDPDPAAVRQVVESARRIFGDMRGASPAGPSPRTARRRAPAPGEVRFSADDLSMAPGA